MAHRQISNFVFNLNDVLGKGSTGTVYLGYDIRNGAKVAIKVIELKTITNEVTKYLIENEAKALQIINHPNVLHAYEVTNDGNCCYMITNYCSNKTLEEYIKQRGRLPEEEALGIFKLIVEGYAVIRNYSILHRDLKPSNVLFSQSNQPVICDFGYCEVANYMQKPRMYYNVGSPAYMAPETILKNSYSEESQVWSLGVIYYEMIYGKNFSEGREVKDAMNQIKMNGITIPQNTRLDISKKIIKECMEYNPSLRIKLRDLRSLLAGGQPKPKPINAALAMTQSVEYVAPRNQDIVLVSEVNKILIQNNQLKRVKSNGRLEQPVSPNTVIHPTLKSNHFQQMKQVVEPPKPPQNPIEITFNPGSDIQFHSPQITLLDTKRFGSVVFGSDISRPEYFPEYKAENLDNSDSQNDYIEPPLTSLAEMPPQMINQYIMANIQKFKEQKNNNQQIKSDLLLMNYPLNGIRPLESQIHTASQNDNKIIYIQKLKQSAISNFTEKQALNSSAFLNPTAGVFALNMAVNQFPNLSLKQKQKKVLTPNIATQPNQPKPMQISFSRPTEQQYHQAYSREKNKVASPPYQAHIGYPGQTQNFTTYAQHYPQSPLPPYQGNNKQY